MSGNPHRNTYRAEMLRRRVYREESYCWICGHYIDPRAEPRTPRSRSVDHIVPLSKGGDPYSRANARLACYGCNAARGDGDRHIERTRGASRDW